MNHVLHLLITVLTCFVWAVVALAERPKRVLLTIDEFGRISRRKLVVGTGITASSTALIPTAQ